VAKKTTTTYGWQPAAIGFHLKGFRGRVLAHVWPVKDGKYRGQIIGSEEVLGPFDDEHAARQATASRLGQ